MQITARCKIHDGQFEKFKDLSRQGISIVKEKEKGQGGTLQYDWFLNEATSEGHVRETYASSDALLAHMGNVGEQLGALMAITDISLEVYGTPSDKLLAATEGLKKHIYPSLGSID